MPQNVFVCNNTLVSIHTAPTKSPMFSRVSRLVFPESTNRYYSAEEVLIRILSEGEQSTTWWHSHSSRRMPASKGLRITYASRHPKAYRQPPEKPV